MIGNQTRERSVRVLWIAPEQGHGADPARLLAQQGAAVTRIPSARAALGLIDSPELVVPHCVFVDPNAAGVHTLLLAMRAQPRLSHIPVVYVSERIGQDVLDNAHAVGADDVFWTGDAGWLEAIVEQLEDYDPEQRPSLSGNVAFILHDRQERRRMLGRIYRNAGFQVVFGANEDDLLRYLAEGGSLAVVVSSRIAVGGGSSEVRRVRKRAGAADLPWILLDEGDQEMKLGGVRGEDRIASMGEEAPSENVLFLTNELMAGSRAEVRRSRRLLLNGLCAFRSVDSYSYRYATLYNISRDGLYVRTLAPLARGQTVHLELTPPGSDECIHLAGSVAWSRQLGGPAQLAPPGFGVQLLAPRCAPADLSLYTESYDGLAHDHQRCIRRPSAAFVQGDLGREVSTVREA